MRKRDIILAEQEYIKIERNFKVQIPELKGCHIRYDDLPGTVDHFPRSKYQVWIFVLFLTLPVLDLMFRFRFDTKKSEALVNIVVATFVTIFKP